MIVVFRGERAARERIQAEPRLDSSTAILDSSRQFLDSSTASTAAVKLSSRQLLDSFSTARQRRNVPELSRLSSCQLDSSTARQLDSSTARQLRLGLPCMNWWLHLMGWLYLRSIHQGRCPLTSVAIKGEHTGISPLHGAPSHRGYHVRASWRCPLRSDGVPPKIAAP